MTKIDNVLKTRSANLLRDFEARHTLHDIVEVTSTKASHILLGVYETQDGKWMARIQPAHLFDGRFKAGTFSLSADQLDHLISALEQIRQVLSDKPVNRVKIVKPANRNVAAITQAPAPAQATEDPVLEAVSKLTRGLEVLSRRLEALESSLPQKEEAKPEADLVQAVAWQVKHTEPPYDCPACGKTYKTRGRYQAHVAEEHGIEL
jgi:hypothetical protein